MALKIENLTGGYSGINVIKNVNLTIEPGQAVGLIGLNGAGKSTTIKHLLGLLRMQKGKITLNGVSLTENPAEFKKMVAYIPETPILYPELTLKEHLELVMLTYGLDEEKAWVRAKELCKMFRLENKLDWLPINFSKGMKQKVMIICAFVVDPSIFIVDEPFLGLDPLAIADLIQLLEVEKQKGKSILMSTHVLDSAEKMCDAFVILHKGEVRAQGNLQQLREAFDMPEASLNDIYLALTKEEEL